MRGEFGHEAQKDAQNLDRAKPVESERSENSSTNVVPKFKRLRQHASAKVAPDRCEGIVGMTLVVLFGYLCKKGVVTKIKI